MQPIFLQHSWPLTESSIDKLNKILKFSVSFVNNILNFLALIRSIFRKEVLNEQKEIS